MVLSQSELSDGRISRSELQRHLEPCITADAEILSTFSARDVQLFVVPFLINVSHINSCLQRTMIKRWKYGFADTHQMQKIRTKDVIHLSPETKLTTQRLWQTEKRRLSFIYEFRAAYQAVSRATQNLESLADAHNRTWDVQDPRQRVKSITALQQSLSGHFEAASDLVLKLLPGQTFLQVYNQAEAPLLI